MLNTVEVICHRLGIDYEKIDVYSISENKNLSDRQKDDIFELFTDPSVYWKAVNKEAFAALDKLAEKCEVVIHSFCSNEVIASVKKDICEQYAPHVKKVVTEVTGTNDINKDIEGTYILIEDRFSTLVSEYNDYEYGVLIRQPYNQYEDLDAYPKIESYEILEALDVIGRALDSGE